MGGWFPVASMNEAGDDPVPLALADDDPVPLALADVAAPTPPADVDGDEEAYPTSVCGVPLKRERHEHSGDEGFRVRCPCHADCRKFRGRSLWAERFGPLSAYYCLCAWLHVALGKSAQEHNDYVPTQRAVVDFIRSIGDRH